MMKPQAGGAVSTLHEKKVKLRKVKLLAQGHIASKQYSRFGLRSADTKALAIYKAGLVYWLSVQTSDPSRPGDFQ